MSKLEYASPVWNNITTTDANQLSSIQRTYAALCFTRFFPFIFLVILLGHLSFYSYIIYKLEGLTWMLFFIHVFFWRGI